VVFYGRPPFPLGSGPGDGEFPGQYSPQLPLRRSDPPLKDVRLDGFREAQEPEVLVQSCGLLVPTVHQG